MQERVTIMHNTKENAVMTEQMRLRAYGIQKDLDVKDSEYIEEITKGDILVFLYAVEDHPIAGCYISNFLNALYVDYLFVLPDYQRKGLRYGQKLLSYILEHKEVVEQYFHRKFSVSELTPGKEEIAPVYEAIGYKKKSSNTGTMYRKI